MLLAIWHPKLVYAEFATVSLGVYRKPVVELEQSSLKGWSCQYSTILGVAIRDIVCDRPKPACDLVTTLLNCSLIDCPYTACSDTRPNWCASHCVRQHLHTLNYFYPRSAGHRSRLPAVRVLPQRECLEHRQLVVRCHSNLLICMSRD